MNHDDSDVRQFLKENPGVRMGFLSEQEYQRILDGQSVSLPMSLRYVIQGWKIGVSRMTKTKSTD